MDEHLPNGPPKLPTHRPNQMQQQLMKGSIVLSNDRTMSIRNKKTVGTRKHNSEATKSAQHAKDSDGPSDEHPTRNTQGTSPSMGGIDNTLSNQPDGRAEWYDDVAQKVEPRSYRSVLLNE